MIQWKNHKCLEKIYRDIEKEDLTKIYGSEESGITKFLFLDWLKNGQNLIFWLKLNKNALQARCQFIFSTYVLNLLNLNPQLVISLTHVKHPSHKSDYFIILSLSLSLAQRDFLDYIIILVK